MAAASNPPPVDDRGGGWGRRSHHRGGSFILDKLADIPTVRQVNRTITLAFIAPTLVQAAVDGRLPRGIGVATVRDFPAEWTRQYERLGLSP